MIRSRFTCQRPVNVVSIFLVLALAVLLPVTARQQFFPVLGAVHHQVVELFKRLDLPQPQATTTGSSKISPSASPADTPSAPLQAQQPLQTDLGSSLAGQGTGAVATAAATNNTTGGPEPAGEGASAAATADTTNNTTGGPERAGQVNGAAATAATTINTTGEPGPATTATTSSASAARNSTRNVTAQPAAANAAIQPRTAAVGRSAQAPLQSTAAASAAKVGVRPSAEDDLVSGPTPPQLISEEGGSIPTRPIPPPQPVIIPVNSTAAMPVGNTVIMPVNDTAGWINGTRASKRSSNGGGGTALHTDFPTPVLDGLHQATAGEDAAGDSWADIPAGPLSAAPPANSPTQSQG